MPHGWLLALAGDSQCIFSLLTHSNGYWWGFIPFELLKWKGEKKKKDFCKHSLGMVKSTTVSPLQSSIPLRSAQRGPQPICWIQTNISFPLLLEKGKAHRTMTCQAKTASGIKCSAITQAPRVTGNLLDKTSTWSARLGKAFPMTTDDFWKKILLKVAVKWKEGHTNTCTDQWEKFAPKQICRQASSLG